MCLALLPLMASLSDAPGFDPRTFYSHAHRTFVHGHLEEAQSQAEFGYRRSMSVAPEWSARFQLLEATAMAWAGSDQELLDLLAQPPARRGSNELTGTDAQIEIHALEATALIHLGRLAEADHTLSRADALCTSPHLDCGSVMRAHGLLYLNRGQVELARTTYTQALGFAQTHRDRLLEGTVLLNLGSALSQEEHHDEALALYTRSYELAKEIGAEDLAQAAQSSQGWESYNLGNFEKALTLYTTARKRAASLGDPDGELQSLSGEAILYARVGQVQAAEDADLRALRLATHMHRRDKIVNVSEDLAQFYIDQARPSDADRYAAQALVLSLQTGSRPDILYCHMLQGEAGALRHDFSRADSMLREVVLAPESQNRMRWTSQHALARMYEEQGRPAAAEQAYKAAIALVEAARHDLHQELSQLSFLTNAARIYDDYIHFLVAQGRTDEALEAADWSRGRTLQQGLGLIPANADAGMKPPPLRAQQTARRTNSTLLFYWLGERQSYLWAVSPDLTTLAVLPPRAELAAKIQRYRRTLLALKDPLSENAGNGDPDARDLYRTLVAPVAATIASRRPVVLFTDGELTQLNFETLLVPPAPGAGDKPHFWIEDAVVSASPSIRLFAAKNNAASPARQKLLLLGNAPSADPSFPALPMAGLEITKVSDRFHPADEAIFAGAQATPASYLAAHPESFAYIHFVAHATASSTDPLESAVVLARDGTPAAPNLVGDDSYKLYAREILRHPIAARLVTISACNSSGATTFSGEGVVGLSWAFLRAGAHNTIAALWDVSDASTPQLMDHLYAGLEQGQTPAEALRNAKLSLLHTGGNFARPFYWAPFQLYSGR